MIDKSMVGRHGTAVLGESRIVGTVIAVHPGGFDIKPDDMTSSYFFLGDIWSFEPDAPVIELPDDADAVVMPTSDGGRQHSLAWKSAAGGWDMLDPRGRGHEGVEDPLAELAAHSYPPVVKAERLRPESEVAAEVIEWFDDLGWLLPHGIDQAREHFGIEAGA